MNLKALAVLGRGSSAAGTKRTCAFKPHFERCGEDTACRSDMTATFVRLLIRRYFHADLSWLRAHSKDGPDLETLFAASHNAGVRKSSDRMRAEIQHAKEKNLTRITPS
jgi:hypothetical protein